MVSVGRVGPPSAAAAGPRRPGMGGFTVAAQAGGSVGGPSAASAPLALDGMLALQEAEGEAVRDREARRHGHALLDALARLQHGLLGDGTADLAALAALVDGMPAAVTPGLAAALDGVALRARVELARRGL